VLNASCDLQAAKDRSAQLQQQLVRRDTDLLEAKAQCLKLQEDLTGKSDEVTAEKQEQAALQRAHHASLKASIHCTRRSSIPTCSSPALPPFPTPSTLAAVVLSQGGYCGSLRHQWQALLGPFQFKYCSMTFHPKLHS